MLHHMLRLQKYGNTRPKNAVSKSMKCYELFPNEKIADNPKVKNAYSRISCLCQSDCSELLLITSVIQDPFIQNNI